MFGKDEKSAIGVIFDLDGTLWNMSSICAEAWKQAITVANIQTDLITKNDIAQVSGLPFTDCVRSLFPNLKEEDFDKICFLINKFEKQAIKAYPKTIEFMRN